MKLVIVGGVAAGMSCAARARRLSEKAEIIVLERGNYVSYANCGLPYYVGGEIEAPESLLVQTPEKLKAELNLDVRTNHNVIGVNPAAKTVTVSTQTGTEEINYDALMLAPGATALIPPLPGINSPRVSTLRTVDDALALRKLADAGLQNVVVLGGGFIGIEAAEAFARRGIRVSVVELAPHILPPVEQELAYLAATELRSLGVQLYQGIAAKEIRHGADHDQVLLADGTVLEADMVLMSVGVRPDIAAFESAGLATERGAIIIDEHGRTSVPGIWAAGDAVLSENAITGARRPVALAGPANRAGRLVADHIFGQPHSRPIPPALGTAIVRVGNLTVAMTGANRRDLTAAGMDFETLHLHPNQHAAYFPGAEQLHLVVNFERGSGRILGAQAVGPEGADKRIDVLATAIRGSLAVDDLIDLDLAYSPPYGQAKDPVNLIGMIAENILNSTIEVWQPEELTELQENTLLLDTRSAAEYNQKHVRGSLNIPHTELRQQLERVAQATEGRSISLLCASGVRSYIAYRILSAAGFKVRTLSGGMLTLSAWLGDSASEILTGTLVESTSKESA